MNTNAAKWVAALESDEFQQTKSVLATGLADDAPQAFCCLGVACEIYRRETGQGKWIAPEDADRDEYGFMLDDSFSPEVLPTPVKEWLGLTDEQGEYSGVYGGKQLLTILNDDLEYSFKAIANVIKSEPDGLFDTDRFLWVKTGSDPGDVQGYIFEAHTVRRWLLNYEGPGYYLRADNMTARELEEADYQPHIESEA